MKINSRINNKEISELILNHGLTVERVQKCMPKKEVVPSNRKTMKEWFDALPDDKVKRALISNTDNIKDGSTFTSFCSAMSSAFVWDKSVEGRGFWLRVSDLASLRLCICESNVYRKGIPHQHKCKICLKPVKL